MDRVLTILLLVYGFNTCLDEKDSLPHVNCLGRIVESLHHFVEFHIFIGAFYGLLLARLGFEKLIW